MANEEDPAARPAWAQNAWKWVVVATGLPVLVGAWLQDFAREHLIQTALLLAGYWIALVIVGFVWRAIEPEVGRARGRLAGRVGLTAGSLLSRYDRTYRAHILARLKQIGSSGAADLESSRPLFDAVYVEVDLTESSPRGVPSDALAAAPSQRTHRLQVAELLSIAEPRILIALGAAGIGKTTLAHHIVRELARGHFDQRRAVSFSRNLPFVHRANRRTVPILITLARDAPLITADPPATLAELATADIPDADGSRDWIEGQLQSGRCVVVVDGLDEVSDAVERTAILRWIERSPYWSSFGNHFVVTSRPDSYRSTPITDAPVMVAQVRRLTTTQAEAFVRRRFEALSLRDSATHAENLLHQLRMPALAALTVNPLLLTMMITLYRHLLNGVDEPRLPDNRVDLYRDICDVLIRRRPSDTPDHAQKLAALHILAFTMMNQRITRMPRAEAARALDSGGDLTITALKVDGLLIVTDDGGIMFTHKTFQEYLAADHIHHTGRVDRLTAEVADPGDWWRETMLFFAGLGDYDGKPSAEPIIAACLAQSSSGPAIALALTIRERAAGISPDMVDALEGFIDRAASPSAPRDIRRAVARALLTRHLDHPVARPISARIHRFFVLDAQEDGRNPVPDTPYPDNPDIAVYGVRRGDLELFVPWANEVLETSIYRLPTESEVGDLADHGVLIPHGTAGVAIWIRAEQRVDLWRREGDIGYVEVPGPVRLADALSAFLSAADPSKPGSSDTEGQQPAPTPQYPEMDFMGLLDPGLGRAMKSLAHGIILVGGLPLLETYSGVKAYQIVPMIAATKPHLITDCVHTDTPVHQWITDLLERADLNYGPGVRLGHADMTELMPLAMSGDHGPLRAMLGRLILDRTDEDPAYALADGEEVVLAAIAANPDRFPAVLRARALIAYRLLATHDLRHFADLRWPPLGWDVEATDLDRKLARVLEDPTLPWPDREVAQRLSKNLVELVVPLLRNGKSPNAEVADRVRALAIYLAADVRYHDDALALLLGIAIHITESQGSCRGVHREAMVVLVAAA